MTTDYDNSKNQILGVDIGLNSTGFSIIHLDSSRKIVIDETGCFRIPSNLKAKYKGTLMVLKAMSMLDQLDTLLCRNFRAVAIETPGGNTQSASAAKALGACGVLTACIARKYSGKTVLVKPTDVKNIVLSDPSRPVKYKLDSNNKQVIDKRVEKEEIMQYVFSNYTFPDLVLNKDGNYVKATFEHIADSMLVLEAAFKTSKLFGGL